MKMLLTVIMMILMLLIEMKVMLTNTESAREGLAGGVEGGIGNAKSDQIIGEVGGGEKKTSRQWFSALRLLAS